MSGARETRSDDDRVTFLYHRHVSCPSSGLIDLIAAAAMVFRLSRSVPLLLSVAALVLLKLVAAKEELDANLKQSPALVIPVRFSSAKADDIRLEVMHYRQLLLSNVDRSSSSVL
jgi:hypothetical protein